MKFLKNNLICIKLISDEEENTPAEEENKNKLSEHWRLNGIPVPLNSYTDLSMPLKIVFDLFNDMNTHPVHEAVIYQPVFLIMINSVEKGPRTAMGREWKSVRNSIFVHFACLPACIMWEIRYRYIVLHATYDDLREWERDFV